MQAMPWNMPQEWKFGEFQSMSLMKSIKRKWVEKLRLFVLVWDRIQKNILLAVTTDKNLITKKY